MESQHLVERKIIPLLPNLPEIVWQTGVAFVEGNDANTEAVVVPCCDTRGNLVESEIGPMTFGV